MAETFLFSIAEKILEKLYSDTFQQIGLAYGVKRELKKLEHILFTIKAVLLDAEEQQTKNRQMSIWLESLRVACYDADDVLDEFTHRVLRQKAASTRGGSLISKVTNFFSLSDIKFRLVMGRKIKIIRERLDDIAANKAQFHLTERNVDHRHVVTGEREMTHSFVRPSDVIGRETEREEIVQQLLTLSSGRGIDRNFSVVSIVGIAGLGKTTIAKLVYNDERVNMCFDLKMWVCVSDEFNLVRLTKEIIKSATSENYSELSIDHLQTRLRDILQGQRFLLVLDDVWNDDVEKWNKLRELLLDGATGSKIMVTTQSHSVASIMGTVPPYNLKGLSEQACWSLFMNCAFKDREDRQHANLESIGQEIVKKCRGVPLAVRSLGSVLFMKTNECDWLFIRDNDIWKLEQRENDILPALKLSYKQLPSYLKECFAFCSIFPKDYKFDSIELVEMWIAQSFIYSSNENEELEDIGNRYIKELWSRSFFQDVEEHDSLILFKMHDLVHDLALLVAHADYGAVNFPRLNVSNSVRHVLFRDRNLSLEEVSTFLHDQNSLRTISFPLDGVGSPGKPFVETCIKRSKYLRVLDLSNSTFEVLPSSVGSLKHLRYLDLSGNVTIKKLPNSICKLLNLQTLRLSGCLELNELPKDIGNLTCLRCLYVTTKQTFLELDKGIGCLTSLRVLALAECSNLKSLGEGMQCLTALRTLSFLSCENLESLPSSMKYLPALESLIIANCKKLNLMEWEKDDDIHDIKLMSFRSLYINKLPQFEALPKWLQGARNTLQYICIGNCDNFMALPEWLQNLTSLQKLVIMKCPRLSASLPEGMQRLVSLKELQIGGCPEMSRRCNPVTGEDWYKISHIPEITLDWKKIR